jgi:hypothetical protein
MWRFNIMTISCDCSIDYDYEPAKIYREEYPKAKKEYKCCECGENIKPGQKYQKVTGLWDDIWSTYKTCMPCVNIRDRYCPHGFYFGFLREQISECLGFNYTEVPEDDED